MSEYFIEKNLLHAIDSARGSLRQRASLFYGEEKRLERSVQAKTLCAVMRRCLQRAELSLIRLQKLSEDLFPIQEEQLRLEDLEIQYEVDDDETRFHQENGRRINSLGNANGIASVAIQSLLLEVFEDFLRFAFCRLKLALPKSRRIDVLELVSGTSEILPQAIAELRWLHSQIVIPDQLTSELSNIEWRCSGQGYITRFCLRGSIRFFDSSRQRKYFLRLFGEHSFDAVEQWKVKVLDLLSLETAPQKRARLLKLASRIGVATAPQYSILLRLCKIISISEVWLPANLAD